MISSAVANRTRRVSNCARGRGFRGTAWPRRDGPIHEPWFRRRRFRGRKRIAWRCRTLAWRPQRVSLANRSQPIPQAVWTFARGQAQGQALRVACVSGVDYIIGEPAASPDVDLEGFRRLVHRLVPGFVFATNTQLPQFSDVIKRLVVRLASIRVSRPTHQWPTFARNGIRVKSPHQRQTPARGTSFLRGGVCSQINLNSLPRIRCGNCGRPMLVVLLARWQFLLQVFSNLR